MRKILSILVLFGLVISIKAQDYVVSENDTTTLTEYNDGRLWAYKQIGDYVVGMTNYVDKNDYGKNYQIQIYIKNLSPSAVTFDPDSVTSTLWDKYDKTTDLKVYTYDRYMKKVKNQQAWAMALTGLSSGLNAGMAGYQTTYTTAYTPGKMPYTHISTSYNYAAASAANMAASTQMATLGKMMSEDKKIFS